jgi:hypothetical protein
MSEIAASGIYRAPVAPEETGHSSASKNYRMIILEKFC